MSVPDWGLGCDRRRFQDRMGHFGTGEKNERRENACLLLAKSTMYRKHNFIKDLSTGIHE